MIEAKKKFGQNFLKDEAVLAQIIQSMPDTPHRIAEIGPGLGDLTKYLVDVKSVTAFEVDTDLCKHLKHQFALQLHHPHYPSVQQRKCLIVPLPYPRPAPLRKLNLLFS